MTINPSQTILKAQRPQPPILIFDIETVPDIPFIFLNYSENFNLSSSFDYEKDWNNYIYYEEFKNKSQTDFPKTIFHAVISICAVFVNPETYTIMDGFKRTIPKVNTYQEFREYEKKVLEEFWLFSIKYQDFHKSWYDFNIENRYLSEYQKSKLKKLPVTFCGYNISNFDLMVIEQRSLINFITCPIEEYVKNLGSDSYRYKYASDKVFDLMNFITNYDVKNARVGLDTLARGMGLGGKMTGMDGSKVAEKFYINNDFLKIEEYCAVDVLISYGVFLAIQKFRGILSEESYKECLLWFEAWLLKEGKPESYKELARESSKYFNYAKKT